MPEYSMEYNTEKGYLAEDYYCDQNRIEEKYDQFRYMCVSD